MLQDFYVVVWGYTTLHGGLKEVVLDISSTHAQLAPHGAICRHKPASPLEICFWEQKCIFVLGSTADWSTLLGWTVSGGRTHAHLGTPAEGIGLKYVYGFGFFCQSSRTDYIPELGLWRNYKFKYENSSSRLRVWGRGWRTKRTLTLVLIHTWL